MAVVSRFVVSAVAATAVLAALAWPVLTQELMCPELYHLEQYVGDSNHGNVCRSGGGDNGFVCPRCCQATDGPPYCGNATVATAPCRATDLSACTAAIADKHPGVQISRDNTLPTMFIDATISQPKTGSGNTFTAHLPDYDPKTGSHAVGDEVRTPKSIEYHFVERQLIVLKTHEWSFFQKRYAELQSTYNIQGCRVYMNLRDPVEQLASNFIQSHSTTSKICLERKQMCSSMRNSEGKFDMNSASLDEAFETYVKKRKILHGLWQGSADLFNDFTGQRIQWVLDSGLPTTYYSLPGAQMKNWTLHVHRTEHLSQSDAGCAAGGVHKQAIRHITLKTSRLHTLACDYIRNKREKKTEVASMVLDFCVAWSECCKDLKGRATLTPNFHIATDVHKAKQTMHTFYEPFDYSVDNTIDLRIVSAWADVWTAAGWKARMLTLSDARRHPLFEQVSQRLDKLESANALGGNVAYEKMCYFRYLAIAAHGGGWMCDYDTIPLAMLNDKGRHPMPSHFTSYDRHVPSLMVGNADQWTALLLRMLDVVEAFVFNVDTVVSSTLRDKLVKQCDPWCNGSKSDMIALLLVGLLQDMQGPAEDLYIDMVASKVTSLSHLYVDAINGTSKDAAVTFCSTARNFKALHVSHAAVHQTFGDAVFKQIMRSDIMKSVRETYQRHCN